MMMMMMMMMMIVLMIHCYIEVDCGSPASPVNGSVIFNTTTYSADAIFSCDVNFALSGQALSVCDISGQWEPPSSGCSPVGNMFN